MQNKKLFFLAIGVTVVAISTIITTSTFAANSNNKMKGYGYGHNNKEWSQNKNPRIVGVVSAIDGTTITITKNMESGTDSTKTTTQYTIDASRATIKKISTPSNISDATMSNVSVADIKIGDTLMVQGTINGTTIAATTVTDGVLNKMGMVKNPMIVGTVSAINGTTITVTKNNGFRNMTNSTLSPIIYTVDASGAVLNKFTPVSQGQKPTPTLILISDIKVGDTLIIKGTISGTDIIAKTITDGAISQERIFNHMRR